MVSGLRGSEVLEASRDKERQRASCPIVQSMIVLITCVLKHVNPMLNVCITTAKYIFGMRGTFPCA